MQVENWTVSKYVDAAAYNSKLAIAAVLVLIWKFVFLL
jgi:hypothetical protein